MKPKLLGYSRKFEKIWSNIPQLISLKKVIEVTILKKLFLVPTQNYYVKLR